MFFQQAFVAVFGDLSKLQVGLRRGERRSRVGQLLVNLGSLDDRQQLAGFDVCADVKIPFPQIAIGSCVYRRRNKWLYIPRQNDLLSRSRPRGI